MNRKRGSMRLALWAFVWAFSVFVLPHQAVKAETDGSDGAVAAQQEQVEGDNSEETENENTENAETENGNTENAETENGNTGNEETENEETEDASQDTKKNIATGLVKKGGKWFFYQKDGTLYKKGLKSVTVSGKKYYYYFGKDGSALQNAFKTIKFNKYYFGKNGRAVVGFQKIDGKRYYFNKKAVAQKGWFTSGKYKYYAKNGVVLENQIAGDAGSGYYYVDSKGIRVTDSVVRQAVSCVRSITKSSWSNEKKLKACYDYVVQDCSYERSLDPEDISKMAKYASEMFGSKKGNCYRGASALAYMAKVLGYPVRLGIGGVTTRSGGGALSPHGWTEIKINGTWYMYETSIARHSTRKLYQLLRSEYPYQLRIDKTYTLTVKNGEVLWS